MLTKRSPALFVVILALATAQPANAQGQVGARASGMAGAFVAVADDATAVYWNPAGVATGSLVSVVFDAGRFKVDPTGRQDAHNQQDTSAVVAVSATAVGLAYYRQGTYGLGAGEPAVSSSRSREEVRPSVHAITTSTLGVSLVQSLGENVVVGVTPKVVFGAGGTSADVDAGVMAWVNHLRAGLVGRNLTTPELGDEDAIELEREMRAGVAWGSGWTGISRVIISFDGDLLTRSTVSGDRRDVAAGLETWWLNQRLGVRGGVRRSTLGEARPAVAAGISAGLKPGLLLEAHVVSGHEDERSWSIGARMTF